MPRNKFGNNDDVSDVCKSLSKELQSIKTNQSGNGSGMDWAKEFGELSTKFTELSASLGTYGNAFTHAGEIQKRYTNVTQSFENIRKQYNDLKITGDHVKGKTVWTSP